jgi:tetratricopeptide (TPR) repeat protein
MFRPEQARRLLEGLRPGARVRRVYGLTWAEYHQVVGEYVEAKQVYADFLCQDPADHEARVALAALDEYVREYEKAKAEYSKVPADAALGRKARLGFAVTLSSQRFFHEAVEVCQGLLAEKPDDGNAMAQLARSLAKAGHPDQAVALARTFLGNYPRHEAAARTVHFALGKVFLDAGRYAEAAREYEWLLARPAGRVPAAYYGLARALEKLGNPDKARQALAAALEENGDRAPQTMAPVPVFFGDARSRLLLADLFAGDYDDPRAVEMSQAALRGDPHNLAALIRLADAQQRLARFSWHIDEAVKTSRTILDLSPTNVRGHLALARSLSVGQEYSAAAAEYDRLIALDPTFTIPQREKARVLFSDHRFDASAAAYQQMQTPSADEKLQADLDAFAQREPRVQHPVQLFLRAGLPGKALQGETAKLAASADPEVRAGLQRILADYEARLAEQTGAHLEGEAKSDKDFRSYEAIPVYKALIAAEPGNEEALFDLGQVYGVLKQTRTELGQYDQLLTVDPLHRDGLVAQERAGLELQPQLHLGASLFSERGRDGLARIETVRAGTSVRYPWGDENDFVQLGFSRIRYEPHDDRVLDGNILSARAQGKCCDGRLLLFGQVNLEDYPDRLHDRPTFEAGAEYDFCDLVRGRARAFLENFVENGECLRQDIHRVGFDLGGNVRPTRTWEFGGFGRLAYYSDVNTQGELYLFNNVLLTFPPDELKLVLDVDAQGFAHQTVFVSGDHDNLRGVIHPYFAPSSFAFYEARIEWTHWISRDYFVHSNQCYYSLQYGIGSDTNLATYNSFRALANFDLKPWLSVGCDAKQVLSPVYNATSVMAYLIIRFPCCLCCH